MDIASSSRSPGESGNSSERRQRPSECKICHRPANGYHCGVPSCKACKTFFRRVCVLSEEYECKFENNCFDLTKPDEIRLRCQACRYKKCVEVGMDPAMLELSSEEENAENLKKLLKRAAKPEVTDENKQSPVNDNRKICILKSKENKVKNVIDMLVYLEFKVEQFRMSAYNPMFSDFGTFDEIILRKDRFGLADRFGPMPDWPFPRDTIIYEPVTGSSGIRHVPDKPDPSFFSPNKKIWMMINTLVSIEYAKTFEFFHKIDLYDQKVLISHITLICMNLNNTFFALSRKVDGCLQPDGTECPNKDEINYPVFSMAFAPMMRVQVQPTEYVLLKAICLCNPTIHGLSEHAQTIITKERQKYGDALFDYCQKQGTEGPSRFAELLGIIPILEKQQQAQKNLHVYHISPIIAKYSRVLTYLDDIMFS